MLYGLCSICMAQDFYLINKTSMSNYKRQHSRQQQQRLDINEEDELKTWTERYGVSAEKIKEAVTMVGDRVSDVVRYLLDGNKTNQLTSR